MTTTIVLLVLAASAALPDKVDFRNEPAFIVLGPSEALRERVDQAARAACPGAVDLPRLTETWLSLASEQEKISRALHAKIAEPPGAEHARVFRERALRDEAWVALDARIREAKTRVDALQKRIGACRKKLEDETFEEIALFRDRALTQPAAWIRLYLSRDPQARLLGDGEWKRFEGTFIPAGETSYCYETVLEKDGQKLLLPARPFPEPLWFDHAASLGRPVDLGGDRGIRSAFPGAGQPPTEYFLRSGAAWDEIMVFPIEDGHARVHRKGSNEEPSTHPLSWFFDDDGHLKLVTPGC